jgi:hypothetical protein
MHSRIVENNAGSGLLANAARIKLPKTQKINDFDSRCRRGTRAIRNDANVRNSEHCGGCKIPVAVTTDKMSSGIAENYLIVPIRWSASEPSTQSPSLVRVP